MPDDGFSVSQWIKNYSQKFVSVTKPKILSCWSKLSILEGGKYVYGSMEGLGLYTPPDLRQCLGEGYPDIYIKKSEEEATPVEIIIQGIMQSGINMKQYVPTTGNAFCTFR
jgi:hypothetical protein